MLIGPFVIDCPTELKEFCLKVTSIGFLVILFVFLSLVMSLDTNIIIDLQICAFSDYIIVLKLFHFIHPPHISLFMLW